MGNLVKNFWGLIVNKNIWLRIFKRIWRSGFGEVDGEYEGECGGWFL